MLRPFSWSIIFYPEDGGSIFLQSTDKCIPHYMVSHPGCYCYQSLSPIIVGLHIPWSGGLGSWNNFLYNMQVMHCIIKGRLFCSWWEYEGFSKKHFGMWECIGRCITRNLKRNPWSLFFCFVDFWSNKSVALSIVVVFQFFKEIFKFRFSVCWTYLI